MKPIQKAARRGVGFVLGASGIGTLIEWYDFFVYGSLAPIIGSIFFPPTASPLVNLLNAFLAFAVGYIMRPVGALVFGYMGDKWGRKVTFFIVLIVMGVATIVMGSLPTYAQAGVLSTIGLFITRLIQGFSIGGELGGAVTYIMEYAPQNKRAFYTAAIPAMTTLGLLLANMSVYAASAILGTNALYSYGWRIPFWIAAGVVVIGIIFRWLLEETPVYKEYFTQGKVLKSPTTSAFRKAGKLMLLIFLINMAATTIWYTAHISNYSYWITVSKIPVNTTLITFSILLAITSFMYIIGGYLADKFGRKTVFKWTYTIAAITGFPLVYTFVATNNILILSIASLIFLVYAAFGFVTSTISFNELAPANVRYTTYSFPYHLAVGLLGGFTPYVTIWLALTLGTSVAGVLYTVIATIISAIVAWIWYPETKGFDIKKTL